MMRSTGGIVYQIHFPGTIKFMLYLWCYIKPDLPILSTNNLYSSLLPLVPQVSNEVTMAYKSTSNRRLKAYETY